MGDTMLHGVLNMPTDCWDDSELDKNQRFSRYVEASKRIKLLDDENDELKSKIVKMRIRCNKIHSEQLQEIRKLKAANMMQSQKELL